jgi:hypothetical protein
MCPPEKVLTAPTISSHHQTPGLEAPPSFPLSNHNPGHDVDGSKTNHTKYLFDGQADSPTNAIKSLITARR